MIIQFQSSTNSFYFLSSSFVSFKQCIDKCMAIKYLKIVIFSLTPINFTDSSSHCWWQAQFPLFCRTSSFCQHKPGYITASVKCFTCCRPFCPVVASSTNNTSLRSTGQTFAITRFIFFNSSLSLFSYAGAQLYLWLPRRLASIVPS